MSEKVNVVIDGKKIETEKGATVLEVCRDNDIYIPALCEEEITEPYGACRMCLVEVNRNGEKSVETSCTTYVQEGMEIRTDTEEVVKSRKINLELLLSEHYGDCIGPCKEACPMHYDVPTYVALIADGKYREALKLIKDSTPVAYTLGAVCPAFCEDECRRQEIEEPIAIRLLKKAVAEYDMDSDDPYIPEVADSKEERIAVVGGGPSGLTAATQLSRRGYRVTIFEAQKKLGGMLRYGIPEFRLPKERLDREIELALEIGEIEVKTGTVLGEDITMDELAAEFDAVYLATGAWVDRTMGIEGEDLSGSYTGIKFLHAIATGKKVELGEKVTVIGGGNTAMDVARTARRLDKNVTILYRRSRKEMPADKKELDEAEEEGIEFKTLTNITKVLGDKEVEGVECIKMELGEPDESGRRRPIPIEGSEYEIETDSVIMAIGQYGDVEEMKDFGIDCGRSWVDAEMEFMTTNKPKVFAGGDLVLGPSTVVESSFQGKRAALSIDLFLRGKLEKVMQVVKEPWKYVQDIRYDPELWNIMVEVSPYNHKKEIDEWDLEPYEEKPQIKVKHRKPEERVKDFNIFEENFVGEEAREEAKRCISCGCEALFECDLRKLGTIYKADQDMYKGEYLKFRPDERHEYIIRDQSKCILCGKCVQECNDILGEFAIDFSNRGFVTKIEPPYGEKLECISCGACVNECPTGALEDKKPTEKPGPFPMKKVSTICGVCGLGCPVNLRIYNDRVYRVETPEDRWNMSVLCERGRYKVLFDYESGYFKNDNGKSDKISLDEITDVITGGKQPVNLIISGDLYNEEAEIISEKLKEYGHSTFIEEKIEPGKARLTDILRADKINLEIDKDVYAPVKALTNIASNKGAELVEKDGKGVLSISHENSKEGELLLIPEKMNTLGISSMQFPGWEQKEGTTIYIGNPDSEDEFDYIVKPGPYFRREGTVVMLNGEKREQEQIITGDEPLGKLIESL